MVRRYAIWWREYADEWFLGWRMDEVRPSSRSRTAGFGMASSRLHGSSWNRWAR